MTREQILVLNERVKAGSSYLFNLAVALTAAVVVRLWSKGDIDLPALAWTAIVIILIFVALKLLYLLEAEAP